MDQSTDAKTIAVINQKGGVGKTTTTVNLGAALANCGHRVLLIDLDPQAHLTMHLGVDSTDKKNSVYQLLIGSQSVDNIIRNVSKKLFVLPSHIDLAAAEVELAGIVDRQVILHQAIQQSLERFDFVLIDCPPSLGTLTINALAAAQEVLICLQGHFLALQGMGKLLETVHLAAGRINRQLQVVGVLLCMFESGTRLAAEVATDLEQFLAAARGKNLPWSQARIFDTRIRRNIKLAESPSFGMDIFRYAPTSHGAQDYNTFARELQIHYGCLDQQKQMPATVGAQLAQTADGSTDNHDHNDAKLSADKLEDSTLADNSGYISDHAADPHASAQGRPASDVARRG